MADQRFVADSRLMTYACQAGSCIDNYSQGVPNFFPRRPVQLAYALGNQGRGNLTLKGQRGWLRVASNASCWRTFIHELAIAVPDVERCIDNGTHGADENRCLSVVAG